MGTNTHGLVDRVLHCLTYKWNDQQPFWVNTFKCKFKIRVYNSRGEIVLIYISLFSSLEGFKQQGRNLAFYCTCGKLDGTCLLILMFSIILNLSIKITANDSKTVCFFFIKKYLYLYVIYRFSP